MEYCGTSSQHSITPFSVGVVELDFDKSTSDGVNIYSLRGDEADFTFLARDTASPYMANRPLLAAGKPELQMRVSVGAVLTVYAT